MRHCALLLTAIFSRGEPMPVHYFEQLGSNFVSFVLDYIEVRFISYIIVFLGYMIKGCVQQAPPTADSEHEIPDVFTGLALAYNLQFPDISTNVTVSCLAGKAGAKVS